MTHVTHLAAHVTDSYSVLTATSSGPTYVKVDADYVGSMVWIAQNLICQAEDRRWESTAELLEAMTKVGSTWLLSSLYLVGH